MEKRIETNMSYPSSCKGNCGLSGSHITNPMVGTTVTQQSGLNLQGLGFRGLGSGV